MPRTGESLFHPEYVPALCTHRPSLLPMNYAVSLRDWLSFNDKLWKLKQTVCFKGKRSRNKAAVGEPAAGSLYTIASTE